MVKMNEYLKKFSEQLKAIREEKKVTIDQINTKTRIDKKFLEAIFLDMKNARLDNSKKGKGGGYYLLKEPADINLAEVIRLFDGAIGMLPCVTHKYYEKCDECEEEVTCGIRHTFLSIRNETVELLKQSTLAQIVETETALKTHD